MTTKALNSKYIKKEKRKEGREEGSSSIKGALVPPKQTLANSSLLPSILNFSNYWDDITSD